LIERRFFIAFLILSFLIAACADRSTPPATEPPTETPRPTDTPQPTATLVPLVSGEGKEVFIFSMSDHGYRHLFAYHPQTLPLTRLTNGAWDDIDPVLSPDGQRIAFASNRNDYWDLYTLELQTGAIDRLTDTPQFDGSPSYSPDGQWITYASYADDNLEVFLLSISDRSSAPIRLTENPSADHSPAWSPGGRQIAFVSNRSGEPEIWIANLDAGGNDRFVNVSASDQSAEDHPAWSFNGSMILWSARDYRAGFSGIKVWDQIAPDVPARLIAGGDLAAFNDRADQIAVVIEEPNSSHLAVYDLRGNLTVPLTTLPGSVHGLFYHSVPVPEILPIVFSKASRSTPEPLYLANKEREAEVTGRITVVEVSGVQAPYPYLNDMVNESFSALRGRVINETGWDALANLSSAYVPLTDAIDPGRAEDWLYTGRAFELNPLLMNAGWLAVTREDFGGQTYWRMYLRPLAQDGSMGEPLDQPVWDLNARYGVDPQAYQEGGRIAESIPSGYWIDFTDLALQYNWERLPALGNWRVYFNGSRFNQFVLTDGLSWRDAIMQMYPPDVFITPTIFVPFTRTPTATPWGYRTLTPPVMPSPRPTFTPSP
jgi:TolB protein